MHGKTGQLSFFQCDDHAIQLLYNIFIWGSRSDLLLELFNQMPI